MSLESENQIELNDVSSMVLGVLSGRSVSMELAQRWMRRDEQTQEFWQQFQEVIGENFPIISENQLREGGELEQQVRSLVAENEQGGLSFEQLETAQIGVKMQLQKIHAELLLRLFSQTNFDPSGGWTLSDLKKHCATAEFEKMQVFFQKIGGCVKISQFLRVHAEWLAQELGMGVGEFEKKIVQKFSIRSVEFEQPKNKKQRQPSPREKKEEILNEVVLRDFAEKSYEYLMQKNVTEDVVKVFSEKVIVILKEKQARQLKNKGIVSVHPLVIRQTPSVLSRTQGHLLNLRQQLENDGQVSEEDAKKYVAIFRDKILLKLEDGSDPRGVLRVMVDFAKIQNGKPWNLLKLREFEKEQGGARVKSFFDRSLSQESTLANLQFFWQEKNDLFCELLGKEKFQKFKNSFEWKKAEKTTDDEKKRAMELFLNNEQTPWRMRNLKSYKNDGSTPLRHVDEDIIDVIIEKKKCSKFEALKEYFESIDIFAEDIPRVNLFVGKWGSWEQEGRFLTHFLNTNPGEFSVKQLSNFEINGRKIGKALCKGVFKYLFPQARQAGYGKNEWVYIFATLINKNFLDLELFLKNPFKMNKKKKEQFLNLVMPNSLQYTGQVEGENTASGKASLENNFRKKQELSQEISKFGDKFYDYIFEGGKAINADVWAAKKYVTDVEWVILELLRYEQTNTVEKSILFIFKKYATVVDNRDIRTINKLSKIIEKKQNLGGKRINLTTDS